MRRPTVLHVVEHWGRPSESFVVDAVRSTTATRAVVAAQRRVLGSDGWAVPVHDLSGCVDAAQPDPLLNYLPPSKGAKALTRLPVRAREVHAVVAAVAVRERAAVLHSHFGLPAYATWRAARRLRRPFSVSLHGWDVLVAADADPAMLEALVAADLVVVPSEFLARAVLARGVREEVVRVVPSGLDLATLPFRERTVPTGPPLITFAGRFAEKKGVLDAARALARLQRSRPLRARFVGHGPQLGALEGLIAELGLAAEVLDGRVSGAVRRALAETDLAVTASRTGVDGDAETLGLVNLEALACGVPLVTTSHGGTAEAVPAGAAELVPEHGDVPAALAAALERLLDQPERWPAMGRAGRAHVAAHYELGARVADLERLWRQLAEGGSDLSVPAVATGSVRTSVVMVTHDRRALLERSLDALGAQTRPADEVVVVDNGSADGTAELLARRVAAQDPPGLRVLTRPGNLPVAEGRNLAVEASTGDVIAFTDDDCRPRSTWLECLLAGMRDGIGLVQGRTTADPDQPLERLSRTQWTPAEFGLYETCNIAYRREHLARVGGFDLGFAEDVAQALGPRWEHYPFGEDTDLGWRIKRSGVASAFAVHAVVDHEVSPPDTGVLLRRAALAAAFPVLVRRVPELRGTFLTAGVVLGPHRARMWVAVLGVGLGVARRDVWPLALALPYLDRLVGLRTLHRPTGRRRLLGEAAVIVRRDAVETAALLRGSVRARSVVL
ncbi:MAG: glycosyl transferase family 2 [Frankiales bacterium]|nr:glycosyl transferase family 2 [Frankiales bacterium]